MARKRRRAPERMCVVCRGRFPKGELRRIALGNGRFVWDLAQRMGGRGAYLCGDPGCKAAFLKGQGGFLRRAFGRKLAKDGRDVRGFQIAQGE